MLGNNDWVSKALGWAGCFFVCAGALCTSLRIDPLNIYFLNLGAIVYLFWSIRTKTWNQVVVNTVLLAIYIMGLFH
jgi:4-hydroxybenzoate polyprenyltransferase